MSEGYWEITEEFVLSSSKKNIMRIKTQFMVIAAKQ
jgi:hypothetical protein